VGAKWWRKIELLSVHFRDEEIEDYQSEYNEYLTIEAG